MQEYVTNFSRGCMDHWTASKAIIELVQNALDSDGEMSYDLGDNYITLTNKDIKVSNKLLMMGMSDKRGDNTKRGQFGMGSVQAMVVLTDLGIEVNIHNNDVIWTPAWKHCDKFQEDILVINETSESNPTSDFTVVISGLEEEVVDEVRQRCLVFQDREVLYSTSLGDIIENTDDGGGEVFCGDLFVCQNKAFKHSYNFKPKTIALSQDRDAVSQWSMQVLTASIICKTGDVEFIKECIKGQYIDTSHVAESWNDSTPPEEVYEDFGEEFVKEHGGSLVTSNYAEHQENEKLKNKSVYIDNEKLVSLIKKSDTYQEAISQKTFVEKLSFDELLLPLLERMEDLLASYGAISYNTPEGSTLQGNNTILDELEEVRRRIDEGEY